MIWILVLALQDQEAIGKAAEKTGVVKSYASKVSMTIEGGGEQAVDLVVDGGYSEEEGVYLKGEYLTVPLGIYRKGGKTAVIDTVDKTWKKAENVKAKGNRTPGKNFQIPHEEINGLERKLKNVKKVESEKGCDTYTAELTEEGAKSFLPANARMLPGLKASGDVKIWINSDGYIAEWMLIHVTEGSANGKDFRITNTRTTWFSQFDNYKPEVPPDAKKALEE
jgi:hypothetical protein